MNHSYPTKIIELFNQIVYIRPRKRRLQTYRSAIDDYRALELDEIKSEYLFTRTALHHRMLLFAGASVALLCTLMTLSWKSIFLIIAKLIDSGIFAGKDLTTIEYMFACFELTITVCIVVALYVLSSIIKYLEFRKNIIEDVLKSRK